MHRAIGLVTIAALVALSACDEVSSVLPPSALECDGTEPALCARVARLGIAQMNLAATGPITRVTLESWDCEEASQAFFRDWRVAEACWRLVVTGERSHGWGNVVLWPDGELKAYW